MTMKIKPSILVSILLGASLIILSEAYGIKGPHQTFTQSFSSSSASAHASSYSSSYSSSGGNDSGKLPHIIGPVPQATAVSSATASAGAAVANAQASAGFSLYTINGLQNASGKFNQYPQQQSPTVNGYGSTADSKSHLNGINKSTNSFEGKYYQATEEESSGSAAAKNDGAVLKPNCCKPIPPGPNGSIYDYKVPKDVNTITGFTGNTDSARTQTVAPLGSSGEKTGLSVVPGSLSGNGYFKPCCKGPFPGPSGSIYDSKPVSAVAPGILHEVSKPVNILTPPSSFPGASSTSYSHGPASGNVHDYQGFSSSSVAGSSYQQQNGKQSTCSGGLCDKNNQKIPSVTNNGPTTTVDIKPVTQITGESEQQSQQNRENTFSQQNRQFGFNIQSTAGGNKISNVGTYGPSRTIENTQGNEHEVKIGYTSSNSNLIQKPVVPSGIQSVIIQNSGLLPTAGSQTAIGDTNTNTYSTSSGYTTITNSGNTGQYLLDSTVNGNIPVGNMHSTNYDAQHVPIFESTKNVDRKQENKEEKTVFSSNPAMIKSHSTSYSAGFIAGSQLPSSTENIILGGNLHEGVQGSPFVDKPVSHTVWKQPYDNIPSVNENTKYGTSSINVPSINENNAYSGGVKTSSKIDTTYSGNQQAILSAGEASVGSNTYSKDSKVTHSSEFYRYSGKTNEIKKDVTQVNTGGKWEDRTGVVNSQVNPDNTAIGSKPIQPKLSTYTSTFYIDLSKPSSITKEGIKIFSKPTVTKTVTGINKTSYTGIGAEESQVSDLNKSVFNGVNIYAAAGSGTYGSSSRDNAFTHRGIPCNTHGCGTAYRHYSNAVPSTGSTKAIYAGSVSSAGGTSYGSINKFEDNKNIHEFSHGGHESSYGVPNNGFSGGFDVKKGYLSYPGHSGGLLSSIILGSGSGPTSQASSFAHAGGYAKAGSYSQANSYSSSSSYASSRSGAYNFHHV